MKRIIGIAVGLSLGWMAAGMAFAQHAPQAVPEQVVHHAQVVAESGEPVTSAVSQLTDGAVASMPFLPLVLVIAAGLFAAGVFVNLMGWAKPEPVEEEAHDDHGHDEHH